MARDRQPQRNTVAGALLGLLAFAAAAGAQPVAAPLADSAASPAPLIAILCYHDVSDDPAAPLQSVPAAFLREQIRVCKAQGWTFLSLGELLAQREHPERLPARVMVLTFDDGYRSFADQALPVLRAEGVRATLAPITSFVDQPHPDLPPLLTWKELRKLASSGVEIASHSHGLHQYALSDPQRDSGPSVTTRRWLPEAQRYEDREEYRSRLAADFAETQRVLTARLGHRASVLVWPYGEHNEMARAQAALAGFSATLALVARPVSAADLRDGCLPRVMVTRRMEFDDPAMPWLLAPADPVRMAQIDLNALWDPDEATFRKRIDLAVERARALGATRVVLPFASDSRANGQLSRAFAMNHQVPLLADVWSMVAAKFIAARIKVWVRTPAMNLTWAWERHPEWRVPMGGRGPTATRWTTRLSPDLPPARRAAADLLADLAVYLPIDGVVFDDDAALLARERLTVTGSDSPAAKVVAIRGLVEECKQAVRSWRPGCRFARIVPAAAVDRNGVHAASAIDLDDVFANDDLAIFDLSLESNVSPASVERLAKRGVARWRTGHPDGSAPLLALLPAYDARTRAWLPADRQQALAMAALRGGLTQLGTRPVGAEGELPIGLLDVRPTLPEVRAAELRR